MLKALELNGFKSFADRTRFEFPTGITVVVGPNGSGKSNVVDAIKWVLGTQSAKALRGKEMTDVIFSGTQGRKHTNSAEVSLVFDNTRDLLKYDAPEVQVTRRVYRSGESEYLINRQPCRLRDIRDLFSGTGVAGGAYSIIEQGKVDALLQSSPQQRRLIFEEAAGVSRFKQKREESGRRLDRVEQNLLRLSDIVDELESRLRSVRRKLAEQKSTRSDPIGCALCAPRWAWPTGATCRRNTNRSRTRPSWCKTIARLSKSACRMTKNGLSRLNWKPTIGNSKSPRTAINAARPASGLLSVIPLAAANWRVATSSCRNPGGLNANS